MPESEPQLKTSGPSGPLASPALRHPVKSRLDASTHRFGRKSKPFWGTVDLYASQGQGSSKICAFFFFFAAMHLEQLLCKLPYTCLMRKPAVKSPFVIFQTILETTAPPSSIEILAQPPGSGGKDLRSSPVRGHVCSCWVSSCWHGYRYKKNHVGCNLSRAVGTGYALAWPFSSSTVAEAE